MFDEINRLSDSTEQDPKNSKDEEEGSASFTIIKIKHSETGEELHVTGGQNPPIPNKNEVVAVGEASDVGLDQHGPSYAVVERTFGYYEMNVSDAKPGLLTGVTLYVKPVE